MIVVVDIVRRRSRNIIIINVDIIVVMITVVVIDVTVVIVVFVISIVIVVMCRQEVYSCWSTASGARVNNYGARIDLILLAEPAIAGQPDAAHHVEKPDVSSNIAFPVLASTQQQQSRYRILVALSNTCVSVYLCCILAYSVFYVMAPIRQQHSRCRVLLTLSQTCMYLYICALYIHLQTCTTIISVDLQWPLLICNISYVLCGRCCCFGNAAMTEHAVCSNYARSSQGRQLCNRCFEHHLSSSNPKKDAFHS